MAGSRMSMKPSSSSRTVAPGTPGTLRSVVRSLGEGRAAPGAASPVDRVKCKELC